MEIKIYIAAMIDKLSADLPGFEEKFDNIAKVDSKQIDQASINMLDFALSLISTRDEHLTRGSVKMIYTLGAYNEERGLHATKQ